mgnify:CR=1 FL=1
MMWLPNSMRFGYGADWVHCNVKARMTVGAAKTHRDRNFHMGLCLDVCLAVGLCLTRSLPTSSTVSYRRMNPQPSPTNKLADRPKTLRKEQEEDI